jgi:hypothetical protein
MAEMQLYQSLALNGGGARRAESATLKVAPGK